VLWFTCLRQSAKRSAERLARVRSHVLPEERCEGTSRFPSRLLAMNPRVLPPEEDRVQTRPNVQLLFGRAMQIPLDHIEPDLRSDNQFGAIGELVSKLISAGAFLPEAEPVLVSDIQARESVMSTGIGFRIALPHAYSRVAKEPVAAFGLSRKGIEYASLDGLPVSVVFLYVVPWGAPTGEHTKFLGRIAGAMRSHKALRRCTTASEIKAILDPFFAE